MRRRRTASSDPEVTSETTETVAAENSATETPPAAPEEAAPAAAEPPQPPKQQRRRPARRKAAASVEEAGGADAPPAEPVAAVPEASEAAASTPSETAATPVVDEPEAAPAEPAPRPKRTRRRTAPKPEEAPAAAEDAPAQLPVAAEEPGLPTTEEAVTEEAAPPTEEPAAPQPAKRGSSTRGRRRAAKTEEQPSSPAVAEPAPVTAAETPAAIDFIAPESATVTEETPKKTRTRGPRKAKPEAAAAEPALPSYQALPAEALARLAETRIVVRKNVPELAVNGEVRTPFLFFVNTEDPESRDVAARQIRDAYNAGIRFFTVLAHLPWLTRDGTRRTEPLDEALDLVARSAPEAFVLPRLIFSPTISWERTHPDEMTRYADGDTGDVSLASRAFWEEEADAALRAAVEHVAQGPHAGRVFGFYLEHGEWFYEKGRGFDYSQANTAAFRAWLRARYAGDVIALRAAWHDGSVSFDGVEIPPAQPVEKTPDTSGVNLLYSTRERRYADFHEFSSDIVAQVITRLGRAVKEASGGRSAVAVSYGYTLEMPRAGSGHLALATLLASPHIDILTGPYSYAARLPGGSAALPAPAASVALAGKLWISEDDTKTFLARGETPDTYNPRIASERDTAAVYARNWAAAVTQNAGISWMDLWGQGWLDDPLIWENIDRLRDVTEKLATRRRNPRTKTVAGPDVAVIVDERSFFGVRADEHLLGKLVANQRDALLRSGARLGFYLLSDLARKNFPDTPRLLLFLNAFRFPADVRAALRERFQNDGRTLAFLYGPGCLETNADVAGVTEMNDILGMHIRLQAWGSKTGTLVTEGRSPLTDGRRGQRLGDEARINPSFTVSDQRAQVLGEYASSGNPSLAVRKHASWQSVFFGELTLTPNLLRGLYRLAGVPNYTDEDDVAFIGDSVICLHSTSGGPVTVALPDEAHILDLLSGQMIARGGRGARLHLAPRETRLLFYGTPAEITRLGGDPQSGPPGLTTAEVPPPPQRFTFGSSDGPAHGSGSGDVPSEDEALMAAALAGDIPVVDKDETLEDADEEDAEETAEVMGGAEILPPAKKKRKRRRGRRAGEAPDGGTDALVPPLATPDAQGDNRPLDAAAAAPRAMPPLSELLPHSEQVEGDLPPLPDEFLPLNDGEETENDAIETADAPASARRRRNRSRRGRGRPGNSEQSGAAMAPDAPGATAEDGESAL